MSLEGTTDTALPSAPLLSVIAARTSYTYALLTVLCALLFLPGLASIPPTDRDEARFMQATKQILETGDWVHIRFQEEPRNKKPIGIYWLQAAAVRLFGQDLTTPWPYRLPSALATWIAVLAVARCGRRLISPEAGLIAGAALATTFMVVVESHIAKTDAALLASVTVAMTLLAELYIRGRSTITSLAFWAAIGVGILIKGPLIVFVAGATAATLAFAHRDRPWLKDLNALAGIPLVLIIVLPWLIAVSGDGAQGNFVADSISQDLLPKLIGGQESHGAPPGTYLAATILTAWPWSVLAPFVLVLAWRHRRITIVRFALAWLIPAWIIFELVPTKLPHYTLPLYPALALLTAWALTATQEARDFPRWVGRGIGLAWRIVFACVAVALAMGIAVALRRFGDGSGLAAFAGATALVLAGLLVLPGFARATATSAAAGLAAAGLLFSLALTTLVLPHLHLLAIAPRLKAVIDRPNAEVAIAGFHEPSGIFLLGTHTVLTDAAGATAFMLSAADRYAVVPEESLEAVRGAVTSAGRSLSEAGEVVGFNYSRGRWEGLSVVRVNP